jgi:Zn-dependent protease
MNLLIFLASVIPLHPHFGWVDYSLPPTGWNNFQVFLGATAVLQLIAVVLNLIPVPPLDGFGVLSPFMPTDLREQVTTPPLSTAIFVLYFIIIWQTHFVTTVVGDVFDHLMLLLRFDLESSQVWNCVRVALYGHM